MSVINAALSFLNTKEAEWRDINLYLGGTAVTKFTNVMYSVKQDQEHLYAGGDDPISIQSGNRSYSGSITLLKGTMDDINTAAIAAGGRDALDVEFDIVVSFQPAGSRNMYRVSIIGVRLEEYGWTAAQNAKSIDCSLSFKALRVVPI